jgi:hypothetical protein
MARKDEEQQEPDAVEEEQDQEYEDDEGGTSINITDETITIAVPRDGNEGETLTRVAKLVDGLGG